MTKQFGCKFIETSAKQKINVEEAFFNLVREIRKFNKDTGGKPAGPSKGKGKFKCVIS